MTDVLNDQIGYVQDETMEEEIARFRQEFVEGLHAMADFIGEHPELISETSARYGGMIFSVWCNTASELAANLRSLGTFTKIESNYDSGGRRKFGPHSIVVRTNKETTCKKVETGEVKTVVKAADPSEPIPEGARNLRTETTTKVFYEVDEPETAWDCGSLLNPSDEQDD